MIYSYFKDELLVEVESFKKVISLVNDISFQNKVNEMIYPKALSFAIQNKQLPYSLLLFLDSEQKKKY